MKGNAEFAIHLAEGFYRTGNTLARKITDANGKPTDYIAAAVVNFSFAIELYLKGILLTQGKSPHGHNLLNLYRGLQQSMQIEIDKDYKIKSDQANSDLQCFSIDGGPPDKAYQPPSPYNKDLESVLRVHSTSFENWRYLYEFGKDSNGYSYIFNFKEMDDFYRSLKVVFTETQNHKVQ